MSTSFNPKFHTLGFIEEESVTALAKITELGAIPGAELEIIACEFKDYTDGRRGPKTNIRVVFRTNSAVKLSEVEKATEMTAKTSPPKKEVAEPTGFVGQVLHKLGNAITWLYTPKGE